MGKHLLKPICQCLTYTFLGVHFIYCVFETRYSLSGSYSYYNVILLFPLIDTLFKTIL